MKFGLSDEEKMLQFSVRKLFSQLQSGIGNPRDFIDSPKLTKEIRQVLGEQGLLGVIEKSDKGVKGLLAACAINQEFGKTLLPYPLLENIIGAYLLLEDANQGEIYNSVVNGESTLSIAWHSNGEPYAYQEGDMYRGNGSFYAVPFANDVDKILAAFYLKGAGDIPSQEIQIVIIDKNDPTVSIKEMDSMDQTYPLYRVEVCNYAFSHSQIINTSKSGREQLFFIEQMAALLSSSELLGISEEVLKQTVEYTKVRKQFEQPIGRFQSIKHIAAENYVLIESSRVAIYYAAWALEVGVEPESVSIAKAYTSDAATEITASGIQVHGGIGFTWECDMHLFFKRARRLASHFGDAYTHRERLIEPIRNLANQ